MSGNSEWAKEMFTRMSKMITATGKPFPAALNTSKQRGDVKAAFEKVLNAHGIDTNGDVANVNDADLVAWIKEAYNAPGFPSDYVQALQDVGLLSATGAPLSAAATAAASSAAKKTGTTIRKGSQLTDYPFLSTPAKLIDNSAADESVRKHVFKQMLEHLKSLVTKSAADPARVDELLTNLIDEYETRIKTLSTTITACDAGDWKDWNNNDESGKVCNELQTFFNSADPSFLVPEDGFLQSLSREQEIAKEYVKWLVATQDWVKKQYGNMKGLYGAGGRIPSRGVAYYW